MRCGGPRRARRRGLRRPLGLPIVVDGCLLHFKLRASPRGRGFGNDFSRLKGRSGTCPDPRRRQRLHIVCAARSSVMQRCGAPGEGTRHESRHKPRSTSPPIATSMKVCICHDPDQPITAGYVRSLGEKRSCRLRARDVNDPTRTFEDDDRARHCEGRQCRNSEIVATRSGKRSPSPAIH